MAPAVTSPALSYSDNSLTLQQSNKILKQRAQMAMKTNPTVLGDPISLKAETSDTSPNEHDRPNRSGGDRSLKQLAQEKMKTNPTQLGDPVSLKAETSDSEPTEDDRGALGTAISLLTPPSLRNPTIHQYHEDIYGRHNADEAFDRFPDECDETDTSSCSSSGRSATKSERPVTSQKVLTEKRGQGISKRRSHDRPDKANHVDSEAYATRSAPRKESIKLTPRRFGLTPKKFGIFATLGRRTTVTPAVSGDAQSSREPIMLSSELEDLYDDSLTLASLVPDTEVNTPPQQLQATDRTSEPAAAEIAGVQEEQQVDSGAALSLATDAAVLPPPQQVNPGASDPPEDELHDTAQPGGDDTSIRSEAPAAVSATKEDGRHQADVDRQNPAKTTVAMPKKRGRPPKACGADNSKTSQEKSRSGDGIMAAPPLTGRYTTRGGVKKAEEAQKAERLAKRPKTRLSALAAADEAVASGKGKQRARLGDRGGRSKNAIQASGGVKHRLRSGSREGRKFGEEVADQSAKVTRGKAYVGVKDGKVDMAQYEKHF